MIQDRRTGLWIPESCQNPEPKFPPVLDIPQDARPGKFDMPPPPPAPPSVPGGTT